MNNNFLTSFSSFCILNFLSARWGSGETQLSLLICLRKNPVTEQSKSINYANEWDLQKWKGGAWDEWRHGSREKERSQQRGTRCSSCPRAGRAGTLSHVPQHSTQRRSVRQEAVLLELVQGSEVTGAYVTCFMILQALKKQFVYHNIHLLGNSKVDWVASENNVVTPLSQAL